MAYCHVALNDDDDDDDDDDDERSLFLHKIKKYISYVTIIE